MSTTSLPKTLNSGQNIRSQTRLQKAFILGTSCAAASLVRDLERYPDAAIAPVAFVREQSTQTDSPQIGESSIPVLGTLHDLPRLIQRERVTVLFLTSDDPAIEATVREMIPPVLRSSLAIYRVSSFYEEVLQKIPSVCIDDAWFRQEQKFRLLTNRADAIVKRLFDLILGSILAVAAIPVMLLAALAVKMDSAGPILYSQMRTGKDGRPFRVFKFRSMVQNAEQGGVRWASERDPRITRVGHFLRTTRIDELPQLWNVLKGEMSLIGPRPERPEFDVTLTEQIPHYQTRYRIKPGLSGWAQVMYPYGASVDDAREKLAYDLYYIKNCSALLDVIITLKTMQVVFFRKGR
jgi:exopolysaccharide biosynthesis polyprenyl glycosylphosphotransferase